MKYWEYPFDPSVKKDFQLDLGQGNTPCEKAPEEILKLTNLEKLYLKREDLNPNGSFKDRALAYQISVLSQNKGKYCVLSSSGNAAISCCAFAQKSDIKPIILVSPNISENKLSQIINSKPYLLIKSKNARRLANYIHRKHNIPILNPSKDTNASIGFETLGQEIYKQNPECDAIFSYATSSASLLGIHNFYKKNNLPIPAIHAINSQDSKTNFYSNSKIMDSIIKETNGSIISLKKDETKPIQDILTSNNINSSFEGQLALFACTTHSESCNNPTVIISGKEHDLIEYDKDYPIHNLETKEEIDLLISNTNAN